MASRTKTAPKRKSHGTAAEQARRDERFELAKAARAEKVIAKMSRQLRKSVEQREQKLTALADWLIAKGYGNRQGSNAPPKQPEVTRDGPVGSESFESSKRTDQ